ncbi:histidine kinase [Paenibacillus sp. IB182496]|uniref:Histidine kinase n=1 Tax=Paenibacillus sabuli TaxID=2772509 RepID=A0A927BVD6_9BACL|nr:sensor histidine kinase [Paenibacillus sabuli]MBD2847526.1 histidine kinase [Paenibacillus sabuli]
MRRGGSLQTRLIVVYSLIIILIVTASFSFFYLFQRAKHESWMLDAHRREMNSMSQNIDSMLYSVDRLAMQLKYNDEIENTFYYLRFEPEPELYFERHRDQAERLKREINNIIGVDTMTFNRVSVISKTGAFIGVGAYYENQQVRERIRTLPWFEHLRDPNVYSDIWPVHEDPWGDHGQRVISVIREIGTDPYAIVEIQIPYSYIERKITTIWPTDGAFQWVIVDKTGSLVYAPGGALPEEALGQFLSLSAEGQAPRSGHTWIGGDGVPRAIMLYNTAMYSGWHFLLVQTEASFWANVEPMKQVFLTLALLLVVLSVVHVYVFSKKLLRPLRHLRDTMNEVTLDSIQKDEVYRLLQGYTMTKTHDEVHHLYYSFRKMLARLEESKTQVVEANAREIKAHYAALQAQINPHFLHNTLSLIGVIGYQSGNGSVMNLTSMLADMFRYATYSGGEQAQLKDELEHNRNYLEIMKIRYETHLQYSIEAEPGTETLRLPKITLQPFIENCFKHGFQHNCYPFIVRIRAYYADRDLFLEIEDNGVGFSASALEQWQAALLFDEDRPPLDSPDGGAGLRNTWNRLRMAYGMQFHCVLENGASGGARVRLIFRQVNLNQIGGDTVA